jgi:TPR repeat protein
MGHGRAMNAIGLAFWLGEGVEKDVVEAIKWFKQSAEKGELRAMRNLALCFRDGVPDAGSLSTTMKSMRLMQQAADGGLVDAMCDLADWLRELSDPAALEWYMKGAEAGNLYCMRRLGSLHRNGACGLQPDNSKALPWYERAAATGDVDSIVSLAVFLQEVGDLVRAVELYSKAADGGTRRCAIWRCSIWRVLQERHGRDEERRESGRAVRAREIELLGNASAMFNLAVCYENGMGVTKSAEKAVELYERAIELGDASAMFNLAVCYENGEGVTKSAEKAVELYERAIELGNASAMFNLALCYENGDGCDEERRESGRVVSARSRSGQCKCDVQSGRVLRERHGRCSEHENWCRVFVARCSDGRFQCQAAHRLWHAGAKERERLWRGDWFALWRCAGQCNGAQAAGDTADEACTS